MRIPNPDECSTNLVDTFGKMELEAVARNLLVLSKRQGKWLENFTKDDYREWCDHQVVSFRFFDQLVEEGYISVVCDQYEESADRYSLTIKFVAALHLK